jgi:hypothetical protein
MPLCDTKEGHDHLLVGSLGPIVKIGKRSIAVGLGNVVKVIMIGSERFDGQEESDHDTAFVGMKAVGVRRKKLSNAARKRSS